MHVVTGKVGLAERFIPTRVGQMQLIQGRKEFDERFIPTRVGQMHASILRHG